jgi:LmbE family N-acetylglucosaminyl deacetylase
MTSERVILLVVAHPDDESIIGGTLARYADEGVRVELITATRGEAGTIFDSSMATPENIAQVREEELRCACEVLGIGPARFLNCSDGAMRGCTDKALEPVVRMIREVRPQVVITFGPDGMYGHPDHIACHQLTTLAWEKAGDASVFPAHEEKGLEPYQPARLFYFGLKQSLVDRWRQQADLSVNLNGESLQITGVPDDQITITFDVSAYAERKAAAWACHRSQWNSESPRSAAPEEEQQAWLGLEHFILARGRELSPARDGEDLFGGLNLGGAREAETARRDIAALKRNIGSRLSYLQLYQGVLRELPEQDLGPLLEQFVDEEQEGLSLLAGKLRRLGHAMPTEATDPHLKSQFWTRRLPLDQVEYLRHGTAKAAEWYEERAGDESLSAGVRATFAELGAMQRRRLERLDAFAARWRGETP